VHFAVGIYRRNEFCSCGGESYPGCEVTPEGDKCLSLYSVISWYYPAQTTIVVLVIAFVVVPFFALVWWVLLRLVTYVQGAEANRHRGYGLGCAAWRAEFSWDMLRTDPGPEWVSWFATSPLLPDKFYLVGRAFNFALMGAICIWFTSVNPGYGLLMYLTNWSNYLQLFYLGIAWFASFKARQELHAAPPIDFGVNNSSKSSLVVAP